MTTEELAGETLVYDLERHRAHHLNAAASAVWKYCDGKTTIAEMAAKLHAGVGLPADEELVRLALKQLRRAHLVDYEAPRESAGPLPTRREIAKRLSIPAALALPLVSSIMAPTPAMAASSGSGNCDCSGPGGGHGHGRGGGRH